MDLLLPDDELDYIALQIAGACKDAGLCPADIMRACFLAIGTVAACSSGTIAQTDVRAWERLSALGKPLFLSAFNAQRSNGAS